MSVLLIILNDILIFIPVIINCSSQINNPMVGPNLNHYNLLQFDFIAINLIKILDQIVSKYFGFSSLGFWGFGLFNHAIIGSPLMNTLMSFSSPCS